ncbi:MAG: LysR substrate-binding domain-containing protein, partial [Lachnospiraceae bacterium]|nr:LysR substrate-binding domain-containing protein [Lachnospiraceae bacterium]
SHPLAALSSVSLAQLAHYPMIRYHDSAAARALVDSLFDEAGVSQITRAEVSDDFHIAGMVAAGLGVAVLVDSSMPDLYGLRKIPLQNASIRRNLYLATCKHSYVSDSVQDFLRFLRRAAL